MRYIKEMLLIHDYLYGTINSIPSESLDGKEKPSKVYALLEENEINDTELDANFIPIFDSLDELIETLEADEIEYKII